jgi:Flp pilus assembly protein TadD
MNKRDAIAAQSLITGIGLLIFLGLACSCSKQAQTPSVIPTTAKGPASSLVLAEQLIRERRSADAAEVLNRLLRDFPNSHEAEVVKGLVLVHREEANATPYTGVVESCTAEELDKLKEQLDSMETIARNYPRASKEKREAADHIFGAKAFSRPSLSLEDVLNCLTALKASRDKALGRASASPMAAGAEPENKSESPVTTTKANVNPSASERLLDQSRAQVRIGMFDEAAKTLNRIAAEYPASPEAKRVKEIRARFSIKDDEPLTGRETRQLLSRSR